MANQIHNKLLQFLKKHATELRLYSSAAIENRYKKIKQCNLDYTDFVECNETDLGGKLEAAQLKASQRLDIIYILKNQKNTHIYQEANKSDDMIDVTSRKDQKLLEHTLESTI